MKVFLSLIVMLSCYVSFCDDEHMIQVLMEKVATANERYVKLQAKYDKLNKKYRALKIKYRALSQDSEITQTSQATHNVKKYKSKKSQEYRHLLISYDLKKKEIASLKRRIRIASRHSTSDPEAYRHTRGTGSAVRANNIRKLNIALKKAMEVYGEIKDKMREFK